MFNYQTICGPSSYTVKNVFENGIKMKNKNRKKEREKRELIMGGISI